MRKTKKITLCIIRSVMILILGIIIGQKLPNQSSNLSENTKRQTIAMYLENEDGGYDLSSKNKFPTEGYILNTEKSTCKNGGTLTQDPMTKKLILSVSNSDQCNVYFDKETPSIKTLISLGKSSQGVKTGFDTPATTDEGIFEMEDDYGTSYYYRGAVENNYVKYGENAQGQEMWWRILRINGNGSLRLIYDGTQGYVNGTNNIDRYIDESQLYNALLDDAKYVGWMYGPANEVEGTTTPSTSKEQVQSNKVDSSIKKVVDAWYKENIVDTGYGVNVSDEIFCNDRSTPGKAITGSENDTALGYGSQYTEFGASARIGLLVTPSAPTFRCPEKIDAYTVSDTNKGNGALTYPVGLITADEIIAAGSGKFGTSNTSYYLYKSNNHFQWSFSPCHHFNNRAILFMVHLNGSLYTANVANSEGTLAPVINLRAEYANTMIGSGTITDPYRAP